MKFKVLFLWIFALLSLLVPAHADAPMFKAGERICFIGDSITHAGSYHTQILLFYVTRFPQMRLEARNCGISGDTASGALTRYAWEVKPFRPTVATVMFGMNDVKRELYLKSASGADLESKRLAAIKRNTENVRRLAEDLGKDGIVPIIITPSPFDQTGSQQNEECVGMNDALGTCASADIELAKSLHSGVVDLHSPMTALNEAWQAKEPDFTIVGRDRVHPGPAGHLVMAYLFLKAQGVPALISKMEIDAAKKCVTNQENCKIDALTAGASSVSFDCLENALPFPVESNAAKALDLIPFTKDLNQETLRISGLKDGLYETLIDGKLAFDATAQELAGGVNLANFENTPQYAQAQEVRKLLTERANMENKSLRTIAFVERDLRKRTDRTPESDLKDAEERLGKLRAAGNDPYSVMMYETYLKIAPEKEALEKRASDLLAQAYEIAIPKTHSFLIRRTERTAPHAAARTLISGDISISNGWGWYIGDALKQAGASVELRDGKALVKTSPAALDGRQGMIQFTKFIDLAPDKAYRLEVTVDSDKAGRMYVLYTGTGAEAGKSYAMARIEISAGEKAYSCVLDVKKEKDGVSSSRHILRLWFGEIVDARISISGLSLTEGELP